MIRGLFLFFGTGLLFSSCMRGPEDGALVNHMVVQTAYDTTRINDSENIFNTYSTFFIRRDTMGYVFNSPWADTVLIDPVKDGQTIFVSPVIDEIYDQIVMAGFNSIPEADTPDFVVKVAVLENFSYYQTIYYPYYTGYYGYYSNYY